MSSKNEKKEDETKDGDNKKDEQKPEEGNEEEEEEDELILEEFGGIEDILEKFSLSMKEVSGVIIVNSDGITVKSTIDKQLTMQVRNYILLILRTSNVRKIITEKLPNQTPLLTYSSGHASHWALHFLAMQSWAG